MDKQVDTIDRVKEFNRFYTNVLGLLNQNVYDSDYSLTEARILFDLNEHGNCTAKTLISKLNIDKSYMSRILKKFERDGLISKTVSDEDNRAYNLELTEKGRELINGMIKVSNVQIEQLLDVMSPGERRLLCSAMDTIKGYFSREPKLIMF